MTCPPHRWNENGAEEGLVLATCLDCGTRQWHATDGTWESIEEANKRNKRDGLELIPSKQRRIMDTSLRADKTTEQPDTAGPPQVKSRGSTIDRMVNNRGNSERHDLLAPQVIEDAKTMTWKAALIKHGIPIGSGGRLRRRWETMGLMTRGSAPIPGNVDQPPNEVTKSSGQLLYEKHAQEVGLHTPWMARSRKARESYERKASEPVLLGPSRKYTPRDYEKEKPLMLEDYYKMTLRDFYKKWGLNSQRWTELKRPWDVKGKVRGVNMRSNSFANRPAQTALDFMRSLIRYSLEEHSQEEYIKCFEDAKCILLQLKDDNSKCIKLFDALCGLYNFPTERIL